ncbi:Imm1 family immunity protein [Polymorphospora sp. NPDC050346]|uniref:Imm1 family immunity protein n=1 Tax=Polymorphospora sp. NPDC050346 TaxID=3155780 RepID=UPI0033D06DB1
MTGQTVEVIFTEEEDPVVVSTIAELDAVLDRVTAETSPHTPPLIALDMPAQERSLMVGVRGAVGVLNYVDLTTGDGYASKGTATDAPTPPYFYCGTWTGITAGAEIPIEQVRAAAREFLTTGDRPTCITWQ